MDAAEAKRILAEKAREDEKRERAPVKEVKASDNPTKPADFVGERERALAKGAMDSDIPAQYLDSTRRGGNEVALGSGEGKREQAPVSEARGSDDPSTSLDDDAMDTSETVAGKRRRTPVEGVGDSDTPTQAGWAIFTWPS